ncbi:divinylchlorophyllide 8-vinylreductase [Sulfitobacter guttiformis]|uniref:Divinyl chlorophyllide a 8-vinyl-reductase, chloroplastic n=2 Tax=Sulfitobacter guttiformis TaxID=74349 RepID=A0A420DTA4_9RHOB|nr:divinylchlorophyllide 8-vinylreductase [Sulfitobacter guttiformis]
MLRNCLLQTLAQAADFRDVTLQMASKRIFMTGATGTAGRATLAALRAAGHEVVCFARSPADLGAEVRIGDLRSEASVAQDGLRGEHFDAVVSCIASRSGTRNDAQAVDYDANIALLRAAQTAGVPQFILLSAICVQKPRLEFQHAKLAFEAKLRASGMIYSIVRPTAFFKSLSGQLDRVRAGKAFLVFGDGLLTACKPISDRDLGVFIAGCLDDPARENRILPIGGPGPAITPMDQAEALFALLDRPLKVTRVPVALMTGVRSLLRLAGVVSPAMADKAELAGIGRYYATESMLVWDAKRGIYDADATPETGTDTLFDFYATLIAQDRSVALGDHSVF